MVWNFFSRSKRAVELYSRQNGATIQRNWSSCIQKYQCPESWNLEAKERSNIHSLQLRFYEHRTLVPNNSFCKSACCSRSRGELVLSILFDRRREWTSQYSCGQQDFAPVLEVHIVKNLESCDSINRKSSGHILRCYNQRNRRSVNEIHDLKEELRSSGELLAELQGSGRSESYEEGKNLEHQGILCWPSEHSASKSIPITTPTN